LFHGQDYDVLTVENEAGTETPIAGVKGVTVTPGVSDDQFYTADSVKIADQVHYEHAVTVEIEYAFWDGTFAKEWLGGSGSSGSTWTDTTDPELFQLASYDHPSRDDSNVLSVAVDNITFPEIPLVEMSEGIHDPKPKRDG
jgi:hypothetical protein